VQTDRTVRKSKPDIVICGNEKRTGMITDLQFQQIKREAEKVLKHTELAIEIQHMWNAKQK
jgi:hypothetical protein